MVPKSDDGTTDGTVFERWGNISLEAGDKFGKTLRICDEAAEYMRKAGLEEVTETRFKVPVGSWPKDKTMKELGQFNRLQCLEGMENWTMYLLTTVLGVSSLLLCDFEWVIWDADGRCLASGNRRKLRYISLRCGRGWRIGTSTRTRSSKCVLLL